MPWWIIGTSIVATTFAADTPLAVTFLTKPTESRKLRAFYRRVCPDGPGWRSLEIENPDISSDGSLWPLLGNWADGTTGQSTTTFGENK